MAMAPKSFNLLSCISLLLLLNQVLLSHAKSPQSNAVSSSPLSFLNNLVGIRKGHTAKGLSQLKKHLTNLGYMKNYNKNSYDKARASIDLFDDDLELAIKQYQTFFHLKTNGILDSKTIETLRLPRCGVADFANSNGGQVNNIKWPRTKRSLTYSFPRATRKDVMNPIKDATQQWSNVTNFTFKYIENYDHADIKFSFQRRILGDVETFDGPSGIWAHAFGPNDGRVHYDGDEKWVAKGGLDLQTIMLHELGHVLGLGHTSDHDAIMYPIISTGIRKGLGQDDINGIRALYNF
ncbi:hypothetical protein BUALT_Bualt01G0173400 [Buddleja alternifolia]|uniref:Peptidase metallopeptidase domain-containing protein n=1 Tax=Buddleja alternifolia TaxID=168488 RepID=A0AAV6YIC3_9LAMI|nr:hypothetical protein BUALT_Bualt01G0173400 [Buddleja alternifolia]